MGALALEAPAPGDRLAVCVAALGMLRAEARRRPVLAVVDDVQWVDASSRECIEYIARRASGQLAVVRPRGTRGTRRNVSACRICPSARSTTARRPNSSGSAPRSWRRRSRRRSRRPRRATRWPWSSCPLRLPPASGPASRRSSSRSDRGTAFSARSRAGSSAVRARPAGPAHRGGDAGTELPVIAAACRGAGTDAGQLADAEASGLVRLGACLVTFAHPLIRGLVYSEAGGSRPPRRSRRPGRGAAR